MLKIGILVLCFSIQICFGVDKSNFKTCSQVNFCKRQREYQPGIDECAVVIDSLKIFDSRISGNIYCKKGDIHYVMVLTKLQGHLYRLKITVNSDIKKRFEPKIEDVLIKEPLEDVIKATIDKEREIVLIHGGPDDKGILYLKPFRLDLYFQEEPILSINSRDLLRLEGGTIPKKLTDENGTDTQGAENYEEFKGHKDSQPYGYSSVAMDITLPGFEYVYGIPEHADKFALRNTDSMDPYRLYNLDVFEYELDNPMALYGSVPLMWGHNINHTVGIFWNNPTETWIDVHSSLGSLSSFNRIINFVKRSEVFVKVDTHWISETGIIDLFLMMGDTPAEVLQIYGQLTGTTPLPPMFALGYHQCRWNYNDEKDVLGVDEMMDKHDIPYDVIWLDIEHTEDKKYFTWDKVRFPDPVNMVTRLDQKARKLVTVVDPHIKRVEGWDVYEDGKTNDVFVKKADGNTIYEGWCWPGNSVWPDFNDPRVREWWAKRFLTYEGSMANNTFTWNDMGEPSVFNGPEVSMEKDAIHFGNWEHRDLHNLYGLQVHRATWEGHLLRSNNLERPFVLTRAFFAGSQRYGAIWTGDNTASWGHLKATTPMLLSMSVVGITFCGADVGGFFGNPDHELLTRWYQAGAFHPFFRAHAHLDTKRREPYLLPDENVQIIRSSIHERYKLLPYWYTLFYLSESSNAPILSPMWYHFPKDVANFAIDDQFMVGPAIMVKPVTDPEVVSMEVYLPPGQWYLHSNWSPHAGGRTVTVPITLASIPVLYRAGHIVPRKERVRRSSYLGRYDPYTLLVFLGEDQRASGHLYLDDLHSLQYKTAASFSLWSVTYDRGRLSMAATTGTTGHRYDHDGRPPRLERVVVCGLEARPASVTIDDRNSVRRRRQLNFFFSEELSLLVVRDPGLTIGDHWHIQVNYGQTTVASKQEL